MIFKVAATLAILLGLTATAMAAPAPGPDPGIKKRLVTIDKFPQFGSDKIACIGFDGRPQKALGTCPILKGKVGAGVPFFKWTVAKYNQPQFIADGKDCFLEMYSKKSDVTISPAAVNSVINQVVSQCGQAQKKTGVWMRDCKGADYGSCNFYILIRAGDNMPMH